MHKLDTNPSVLQWASEELSIPYIDLTTRKTRRYFPDFLVKSRDVNGKIGVTMIEIKPAKDSPYHSGVPAKGKKTMKRHLTEVLTWHKNKLKWDAAEAYCKARGWTFKVMTERELKFKN